MKGVWRIDTSGETYKVKFYTPSDGTLSTVGAMSVCVDGYNRVWVGSNGNGLDLYDRKNDRFVSVLNDYFRNGDVVFSMLEDDEHTFYGLLPMRKCITLIYLWTVLHRKYIPIR